MAEKCAFCRSVVIAFCRIVAIAVCGLGGECGLVPFMGRGLRVVGSGPTVVVSESVWPHEADRLNLSGLYPGPA